MNLIIKAAKIATEAHEGQRRKYTNTPYIYHPARVAGRIAIHPIADEITVSAGYVHDVVEDCKQYDLKFIAEELGSGVADLVEQLTNPSKNYPNLPRHKQKEMDRDHLKGVTTSAKVIKMIDRYDNLNEMPSAPDYFIYLYARESRLLIEAIADADEELAKEVLRLCDGLSPFC